jgi:hypothetical protein
MEFLQEWEIVLQVKESLDCME